MKYPPYDSVLLLTALVFNFQSTLALYSEVKKLQCSLYIWQRLLKLHLSEEQAQVIVGAAQNVSVHILLKLAKYQNFETV